MTDDQTESPEEPHLEQQAACDEAAESEEDGNAPSNDEADSAASIAGVQESIQQLQRMASLPIGAEFEAKVKDFQNAFMYKNSSLARALQSISGTQSILNAIPSWPNFGLPQNFGAGVATSQFSEALRAATAMPSPNLMKSLNVWSDQITSMVSGLQSAARAALLAGFATKTQEFLTTDSELRYRRNWPVWHYTNGYALLSILRNGQLWASSPQNLNDASELTHGFEIIREALTEHMEDAKKSEDYDEDALTAAAESLGQALDEKYVSSIIHDVYYISASTQRDSLTLWRNYADGDGFAVGIDASVELSANGFDVDHANEDEDFRDDIPLISGWYRVTYNSAGKKRLAKGFIQNAIDDIANTGPHNLSALGRELQKQAVILASTMKHEAFKDEKEVRWITTNFTTFDQVQYEHGRRSIVPVLKIMTSSPEPDQLLPLKGLWCSPLPDASIIRTMQGLLQQRGYKHASNNVRKSQQPFKG